MLRARKIVLALMVSAAVGALAAGCIQLSAPPVSSEYTAEAPQHTVESESLLGAVGSVVDGVVKLVFKALTIVGDVGGSLSNGRWQVDVPAGAYSGSATVKIGVSSNASSSCQLEISPAEKNGFRVPVQLTADCSNVPSDQLKDYVIFWFNPATGAWVPVDGSTVDLAHKTVSAPLKHFSTYAVGGKAGW